MPNRQHRPSIDVRLIAYRAPDRRTFGDKAHINGQSSGRRVQLSVLKQAFRNAVPILSSTAGPVAVLALGYWALLGADTTWTLAGALIAGRLLFNGVVVAHYRGERITLRTMLSGVVLATLALAVALLKAHLTH